MYLSARSSWMLLLDKLIHGVAVSCVWSLMWHLSLYLFKVFAKHIYLTFLTFKCNAYIKGFQKKLRVPPVRIELTSGHSGLEVWCLSNCSNQTYVYLEIFKLNFVSCITSLFGLGSSESPRFTSQWKISR